MKWMDKNITQGTKTYIAFYCETENKKLTANLLKKTNKVWFISIKFIQDTSSYIIFESLVNVESKEEAKLHAESILINVNNALTRYFSNYGVPSKLENGHLIMPCPVCFKDPQKKMINGEYQLICLKDGIVHCDSIAKNNSLAVSRWNFYVGTIVSQIMEQERNNYKLNKNNKRLLKEKEKSNE